MNRMLPAALALACVTLLAALIHPGFALAMLVVALMMPLPIAGPMAFGLAIAVALVLGGAVSPAFAQAVLTTSLEIPWGTWLSNALLAVSTVAVPVVSGFAVKGIQQVAPWASLFLSNARVESMVQNVTNYGLNAIDGAAKGKVLTIPVGSAVIAKAVQRGIDAAPAAVVKAAGGPQGLAERVFRTLHLEEGANAVNTLAPALAGIPAK